MNTRVFLNLVARLVTLLLVGGCAPKAGGEVPQLATVLPTDTRYVLGFSLEKAKSTRLYQEFVRRAFPGGKADLDDLCGRCGLNLEKDVDSVVFARSQLPAREKFLILIRGELDEARFTHCMQAWWLKGERRLAVEKAHGVTVYRDHGRELAFVTSVGRELLVSGDRQYLADAVAARSPMSTNREMVELLAKADPAALAWGAMFTGDSLPELLREEAPRAGFLLVNYAKGLDVTVGLRYPSHEVAAKAKARLSGAFEQAKGDAFLEGLFTRIHVAVTASDALVSSSLTDRHAAQFVTRTDPKIGPLVAMFTTGTTPDPDDEVLDPANCDDHARGEHPDEGHAHPEE